MARICRARPCRVIARSRRGLTAPTPAANLARLRLTARQRAMSTATATSALKGACPIIVVPVSPGPRTSSPSPLPIEASAFWSNGSTSCETHSSRRGTSCRFTSMRSSCCRNTCIAYGRYPLMTRIFRCAGSASRRASPTPVGTRASCGQGAPLLRGYGRGGSGSICCATITTSRATSITFISTRSNMVMPNAPRIGRIRAFIGTYKWACWRAIGQAAASSKNA